MVGPVWVSTVDILQRAWGVKLSQVPTDDVVVTSLDWNRELNLGWLMFSTTKGLEVTPPPELSSSNEWSAIKGRIVLVTPKLFSQIVNSNLEVRTSVSINPATGAAEEGALFTYEAIPRATWLWCDIVEDDYNINDDGISKFPITERQCKVEIIQEEAKTEKKKRYQGVKESGNPCSSKPRSEHESHFRWNGSRTPWLSG